MMNGSTNGWVFLSFYYHYTIKLVTVFALISFLFSSSYDDSFFLVSTFSFSSFDWNGGYFLSRRASLLYSLYRCKLN